MTAVPLIPGRAARFVEGSTLSDYYKEQAEEVLAPVREFAVANGWNLKVTDMHGPAAESIVALAREISPDLIVMGAHGHSALGNMVLGSVATGVLAACTIPVLLIR